MKSTIKQIVKLALAEDLGDGDITARLIPVTAQAFAKIISQQEAIICGVKYVNEVFRQLDLKIAVDWKVKDGDKVLENQVLCEITGNARLLLSGERTALNFLQTLSSVATLTHKYVELIKDTNAQLLDTRKTLPGLRLPQKYAVLCGGGKNHRMGLYDAILIKENHIAACGSITNAINKARSLYKEKTVEVEVRNNLELVEALGCKPDIIMLDNFSVAEVREAVMINNFQVKLEVSGGINLENIRDYALAGVDYISVGSITKTVIPVELSMLFL